MALKIKTFSRYREDKEESIKKVLQENLVRFNAMIPVSLHNKLKVYVAKKGNGVTMTSIVTNIIDEFLSKNPNE